MKKLPVFLIILALIIPCTGVSAVEEKSRSIVCENRAEKNDEPLILGANDVSDILGEPSETSPTETTEATIETDFPTEDSTPEPTEEFEDVPGGVEGVPVTAAPECEEPTDSPNIELPTSWQPFTQAPTEVVDKSQPQTHEKPEATQSPGINNEKSSAYISANSKRKAAKFNFTSVTLKCGKRVDLNVKNKNGRKVTFTSDNNKIAKVNKKGIISTLKKGRAKITAKVGKKKLYCIVKVVTSPKLSDSKVKVKKGKTAVVKIIGRASNVKNKYKSTEYALIISKAKADKITVRGLKKGSTVLKIKVNGVILKLNVKVT